MILTTPSLSLQSFNNIFTLLHSVKSRDEGKGGEQEGAPAQPPKTVPKPARTPTSHAQEYNRYEQEVYKGKAGGCGVGVVWV